MIPRPQTAFCGDSGFSQLSDLSFNLLYVPLSGVDRNRECELQGPSTDTTGTAASWSSNSGSGWQQVDKPESKLQNQQEMRNKSAQRTQSFSSMRGARLGGGRRR